MRKCAFATQQCFESNKSNQNTSMFTFYIINDARQFVLTLFHVHTHTHTHTHTGLKAHIKGQLCSDTNLSKFFHDFPTNFTRGVCVTEVMTTNEIRFCHSFSTHFTPGVCVTELVSTNDLHRQYCQKPSIPWEICRLEPSLLTGHERRTHFVLCYILNIICPKTNNTGAPVHK